MSTKTWVILMMEFQYAAAPLAEASLVPLNIKADMTSIGLKLRPTDKTFGLLPQGAWRRVQKNGCQAEREKGKLSLSVNLPYLNQ
jgi:hypothetical protein